jgi:membrane fusion protein (multidrug efflux system)
VVSIDARVNQQTRNVLVRAQLDNPDNRLLPGMYANVSVLAGTPRQMVTLPRTAISYSLYGDSVYVVKPEGGQQDDKAQDSKAPDGEIYTVERRFVRLGETRQGRVAVLEGVEPGEQVVTSGQLKLQPGGRVQIDNKRALKAPAERPRT